MTKWDEKMHYGKYLLVILVLGFLLLGCTYLSNSFTEYHVIAQQKAMIGRLYEMDADVCEKYLQQMFKETKGKDMEKGTAALVEFGYTQEGLDYLYAQNKMKQIHGITLCLQGVLICGVMVLAWGYSKKEEDSAQKVMEEKLAIVSHAAETEIKTSKEVAQKLVENIAHQIKTPLACVSLSLDLLLETLKEEGQKKKVKEAFQYLKQIELLMKKLLDIGRLEAGKLLLKKEVVSLEEIITGCMHDLDSENQRIVLRVEGGEEKKPVFYGDYDWLKEVFSNILKNCLEHSKVKVHIKLRYQKELIFMEIRDFGEGFAKEDLSYIFDRFYIPDKAKSSHTGIGMNLAKLVIEKHFGTIEAMNHEEGGALISICFPLYGLKNEKTKI